MSEYSLDNSSKLAAPKISTGLPRRLGPGIKFISGPIPLCWAFAASNLPGKSLQVGLILYYLAGVKKQRTVPLSQKLCREAGVKRGATYRALKALETKGLVSVKRSPGRNTIVTILVEGTANERPPEPDGKNIESKLDERWTK